MWAAAPDVTYLSQQEAIAVDEDLMGALGFSVDQLMELAGLSVACSLAAEYPAATHRRVLVLAGPGNNGGDGLVAGRHLHHFGYDVQVCLPKLTDKPLYHGLVTQCTALGLPFRSAEELQQLGQLRSSYDVVVDALFGFSFRGTPRPPFAELLQLLAPSADPPSIVSVDVPSGWDVELGDAAGQGLRPDMLVSLTAPKAAARHFKGAHHYLGGRFVPPAIRDKYSLRLPSYPGTQQCVRLGGAAGAEAPATAAAAPAAPADMRISYRRGVLLEEAAAEDPMRLFDEWFKEAVEARVCEEPNAIAVASVDELGRPSVRMVLLKGYDERGFIFYTNYDSRKGRELAASGHAAFTVFWEGLQRSVRVEGTVERVPEAESTAYFHSRPRGSQIGAWVSRQSAVVRGGREEIEARQRELEHTYEDASVEVPKPPHWGGFLIRPVAIEFWQGRPSRLHDRLRYTRGATSAEEWDMVRLYP